MEEILADPYIEIVSREKWGALPPKCVEPLALPGTRLFFMHTDTKRCKTKEECCKELKELQKSYMDQGMPDLPFSFLVGSDLRIYEGRGWGVRIRRRDVWEWNDDRVVIALISPQRIKVDDKNARKMMYKAYAFVDDAVDKGKLVDFDKHTFESIKDIEDEREMMKKEYNRLKKEAEEEEKEEERRKQRVAEHFAKEGCEGSKTKTKEELEKEEEEIKKWEEEMKKEDKEEKQKEKDAKMRDHPLKPRRRITVEELFAGYNPKEKKKKPKESGT